MRSVPIAWRSATSRLILIYGVLFATWALVLLGAVQWQSTRYVSGVIDQLLQQRMHYLAATDPARLQATVEAAGAIDPHGFMSVGLFDDDGRRLAGNIDVLPGDVPRDDTVHLLATGKLQPDQTAAPMRERALAKTLADGRVLVVARDTGTIDGLGAIIRHALLWGVSLTLVPGLLGGLWLRRGHARRIRALAEATAPIRRGDLAQRLPVSRRGDELDQLAGIVNAMLDEIERLMGEVKGVCDNIAHDLRTPLTHLRARLYRVQQQWVGRPQSAALESCMADIDAVLARFRALLRVSELEDRQRGAFFVEIDPAQVLRQVHEFYAPLAEDHGQTCVLDAQPLATVRGDPQLLFEALANLVGNAIKFSPPGGVVRLCAAMGPQGPRLEISDSGPGIPADERAAVTRRFYRGDNSRAMPGSGLGLSIVSAIVRLHGFALDIGDGADGGARITLYCHPVQPGEVPDTCLVRAVGA